MSESETPPQNLPNSSSSKFGAPLTLQVWERRFVTTAETLRERSGFFAALLSGRWEVNTQADGSYFVDADGDVFEHILRYLRRGVLPLFYDKVKGHDYALYLAVLEEAKYFQIPRLEKWIVDKTYLQAVKVTLSITEFDWTDESPPGTAASNVEVTYVPGWKTKRVYVCPRRISIHRGDPSECGRQCKNAREKAGIFEELFNRKGGREWDGLGEVGKGHEEIEHEYVNEEVLTVAVIWKQTTFEPHICVEGQTIKCDLTEMTEVGAIQES